MAKKIEAHIPNLIMDDQNGFGKQLVEVEEGIS